jgi:hypothetical protein
MDTHHSHNATRLLVDENFGRQVSTECDLDVDVRDGELWLSRRASPSRAVTIAALLIGMLLLTLPVIIAGSLPGGQVASSAVKVVSTVFGGALVLIALYLPFSRVTVRISRKKIERIRYWSGISLDRRTVRTVEVEELQIDPGRHGTSRISYDLVGLGSFGRLKLISGIPDRALLETLRRQIMLAAGIRPSGTH